VSEPLDVKPKTSFHIFLFFLFFTLFTWPFITVAIHHTPGSAFFVYAFTIWLILILAMFIASSHYHKKINSIPHKES